MSSATIVNMEGAEVGAAELNDAVFNAPLKPQLLHQVAIAYLQNRRQGTHETKTRKEVRGGGKKPYRQKGTGNARHGSTREPQMRGGGTVFGPHMRSYRKKIPVQFKKKALCSILSDRLRNRDLCVLERLDMTAPATKELSALIGKVASSKKRTLFVTGDLNENAVLSARNLSRVDVVTATDVNALDILQANKVVLEQSAISKLEERLA